MNGLIQFLANKADIDLSYSDILTFATFDSNGFNYSSYDYPALGDNYNILCMGGNLFVGSQQTPDSQSQWAMSLFEINNKKATLKDTHSWKYSTSYSWKLYFYNSSAVIYAKEQNINTGESKPWSDENWGIIFYK